MQKEDKVTLGTPANTSVLDVSADYANVKQMARSSPYQDSSVQLSASN